MNWLEMQTHMAEARTREAARARPTEPELNPFARPSRLKREQGGQSALELESASESHPRASGLETLRAADPEFERLLSAAHGAGAKVDWIEVRGQTVRGVDRFSLPLPAGYWSSTEWERGSEQTKAQARRAHRNAEASKLDAPR